MIWNYGRAADAERGSRGMLGTEEQHFDLQESTTMDAGKMPKRWFLRAVMAATIALWTAPGQAQIPVLGGMLDPAIDEPGKPFSYFWHPTDVIGALYDPVASEVTPEGYVYTGFGELMFFVGIPPEPVERADQDPAQGLSPHRPVRVLPARRQVCDQHVCSRPGR